MDYFGFEPEAQFSSNGGSNDRAVTPAAANAKPYKKTNASLQLQVALNIGSQFHERLTKLEDADMNKHMAKLSDARQNYEMKKEKLEVALQAH